MSQTKKSFYQNNKRLKALIENKNQIIILKEKEKKTVALGSIHKHRSSLETPRSESTSTKESRPGSNQRSDSLKKCLFLCCVNKQAGSKLLPGGSSQGTALERVCDLL